ncbi:XRE family transcriptional regulator (plasmid) [Calothrix sp. NIES-4071]|nr:XRE family transcriptional regulator [Calothrix sp. NIES-4071]BAZ64909.1 XRE family transcriptional regulator [Calothrix sp. NIES-4105]
MIDAEKINLSSLPWLPLDEKLAFPRNPAIYFAIDSQGVIQYIGRSIDPKNRWVSHHKYEELKAIGDIKIVYLFVDSSDLLPELESTMISWFNPPLNIAKFATYAQEKTMTIEDWEKQVQQEAKKGKAPYADVIGAELAEQYRRRLLWVEEFKSWMEYSLLSNGVWSFVSDTYATSAVYNIIRSRGIRQFKSVSYVANVIAYSSNIA